MEEKENALYVPDAGELPVVALREAEERQRPYRWWRFPRNRARDQNSRTELPNELFPDDDSALLMDGFVEKLNTNNFIVFLDEQGQAFTRNSRSDRIVTHLD